MFLTYLSNLLLLFVVHIQSIPIHLRSSSHPNNPCNPGRCPAPPTIFNGTNYVYHVTTAMSLDAPDAKALLPDRSTSISNSMDSSNFGAITFRFALQLCGQNRNNGLQIYRAQLSDIETRCNDISGEIEASSNDETRKYSKRRRSNVAVIIVRIVFISSFLFYCLLLKHNFSNKPKQDY